MSDGISLSIGPASPFQELDRVRSTADPEQLGTVLSIRPAGGLRVLFDKDRKLGGGQAQTVRNEDVELVERGHRRPIPTASWRVGMNKGPDLDLPTWDQATDHDPHPRTPPGPPPARQGGESGMDGACIPPTSKVRLPERVQKLRRRGRRGGAR